MDTNKDESTPSYLENFRQTLSHVGWVWREFTTQKSRKLAVGVLTVLFMTQTLSLLWPYAMKLTADGLETKTESIIAWGFGLLLVAQVLPPICKFLINRLGNMLFVDLEIESESKLAGMFYEKSLGQHLGDSQNLSPANLTKGISRTQELSQHVVFSIVPIATQIVAALALLFWLHRLVGLAALAYLGYYFTWTFFLNRRVMAESSAIDKERRRVWRKLDERMRNIERIKAGGKETEETDRHRLETTAIGRRDINFEAWLLRMDLIRAQSGTTLFACGMLVFAICQVYSGAWTIGTLIPFGSWMYMLINLADRLTESESAVSKCLSSIKTLREVLDEPAAVTDKPDALNFAPDGPVSVEFDRVSFSYPNQEAEGPPKPVLRNVSFTVEHGEKVAVIGPSGTGKTTLLHKVLRSRDPDSGRVLINGLDLRDLKQATFKRVVSYVPQGAPLFDETLRNLMLYAVPPDARSQITDELIWATLRLVKADLGPRFDKGLETKIGRDGIELSGGERQRLSAAMALMNPHLRLLVMDEPTSNLDAETQAAFHDGLSDAVASGVTTFVVAHRLSTVRDCDRFVVLKPAAELAENETQVEAVARSFGELNRISPTFRKVAKSEGLTLTAKDQTTELGDFNRLFGAKPVIGQA